MMEKVSLSFKYITGFSIAGLLFSGSLSAIKLWSGACAVRESCPYLLGIPVCVYGFVMYLSLVIILLCIFKGYLDMSKGLLATALVSFLGILFSGYFSIVELPGLIQNGFGAYTFGVPTCMLGLLMYMLIFVTSVFAWNHHRGE